MIDSKKEISLFLNESLNLPSSASFFDQRRKTKGKVGPANRAREQVTLEDSPMKTTLLMSAE